MPDIAGVGTNGTLQIVASMSAFRSGVVLDKTSVAVSSLAEKVVGLRTSRWWWGSMQECRSISESGGYTDQHNTA